LSDLECLFVRAGLSASTLVLRSYEWMCKRRAHHHYNQSVWDVRANKAFWFPKILFAFNRGTWQFSPTCLFRHKQKGELVESWSAQDAWLIKIMAEVLKALLSDLLSLQCYHIERGSKCLLRKTLMWIQQHGNQPIFVYKTDVKSYYQSIRHDIVMHQLADAGIKGPLLTLVWSYLTRLVDINATLTPVHRGIPKGCSLSPVLSALYLSRLDQVMEYRMRKGQLFYGRFQDDWVIMSTSRCVLKRAIRQQHKILQQLDLELRPEKTFMGYATKGFDFLGYRIQQIEPGVEETKAQCKRNKNTIQKNTKSHSPAKSSKDCKAKTPSPPSWASVGKRTPHTDPRQRSSETISRARIALSKTSLERFYKKRTWLYEQKATPDRLGAYTRKFEQWATGGFKGIAEVNFHRDPVCASPG